MAGVRAYPTHWRITQMPGVSGWALLVLLESVLARMGITSALLLLDVHDPLRSWLQDSGRLGLLQAPKAPIYTQVLAKLNGLTVEQVVGAPPQPVYASAFDFT